ncbi:hypothetical protein NPS01_13940 [Nocardioides psychrotolerans]|uniref:Uncharacterized protein n=1 Tax=Nocardioides psychrotolerans TaxID=1005945 RepID=A0A1I3H6P1_9ACTN|nr:hypothetical protein [Nocardioides psychrotolerans]GEP37731.1 hypothetical protein NPS01_13940 [Nocardioides psychrotolerans]SFI31227.1 hypothetical protein SAMN05216561_10751 [Nocardioides psychrotolerans]
MSVTVLPFAWGAGGELVKARVTQCALSRICGMCSRPLGRPVAFVGTPLEVGRNAFHAPPLHAGCVTELRALPYADPTWEVVTTSGFEFVRPNREDADQQPTFEPNSLL